MAVDLEHQQLVPQMAVNMVHRLLVPQLAVDHQLVDRVVVALSLLPVKV